MRNKGDAVKLKTSAEGCKSDFEVRHKSAETLEFPAVDPGQSYPHRCPGPNDRQLAPATSALGAAMDVNAVAEMLGCSPWTVRNRYLAEGLPHVRASDRGRLVFFKTQVIRWIVERQQKGGKQ